MGERTQAAAGCLTVLAGAGAGLALWAVQAHGRFRRFEQAPDRSVLCAELPLMVLGGVAAALGGWALARRVRLRRSGS
ncbi:hypothetical protein [Streptomyces sp. NPDC058371]|uniref:hypothetical protein n=1 Tax=Streptomyces sp. NPDC058371 TaxID=3346463 RepID=UPI003650C48E